MIVYRQGGDVVKMTNDKIPFTLRLTPNLDKYLTEKARDLGVSKNALILMTLQREFKKEKQNAKECLS